MQVPEAMAAGRIDPVRDLGRYTRCFLSIATIRQSKTGPVAQNEFAKNLPKVSSDGRWVAYYSEESGQSEIYVAAFPTFKERRQVSNGGGCQPLWRKDGKELFYFALDGKMMSIDVRRGTKLETSTPKVLFQVPFRVTARGRSQYCVTGDGQRFIFGEPLDTGKSFNVVLNWIAGLNHR